ncbi:MAG: YhbY family RNA-binding protein [Desulfurococcales archaeon]|nr:YhbY family RNA-binding protein [Desulfurococcales archaeon]
MSSEREFRRKLKRRDINRIMSTEKAVIRIGVKGLTEGLLNEIKRQLNARGAIKIRVLKSVREKITEEDLKEFLRKINARIISRRGYVYLVAKT